MGYNLLRHASLSLYNHFDTHEAKHHNTVFNHSICILPYQYVSQIPTLCLCHVCARTCARMRVCVDTSVYIYAQASSSLLEYVCQDIPQESYI